MTARMTSELACSEMVRVITDYLEGAMAREERTRFEQHLVFCKGCAAYLRQMRGTLRALGSLPAEALAPESQRELLRVFSAWKASKPLER